MTPPCSLRYPHNAEPVQAKIPIRVNSASAEDKERIKAELGAILATDHFVSSKRYPAFLAYIVEKTLEGHSDELKERSIGVDVFKRKPDFDTSADTVVRFTAGEVRKRLSSIYLGNGRTAEVQIDLPTGSYVPEFFRLITALDEVELQGPFHQQIPNTVSVPEPPTNSRRSWEFPHEADLSGARVLHFHSRGLSAVSVSACTDIAGAVLAADSCVIFTHHRSGSFCHFPCGH